MRLHFTFILAAACALGGSAAFSAEPFIALDRVHARALTDTASYSTPTIIALWSTECPYCKENLRLYAQMAKTIAGLRLISIATEPPSAELATHLGKVKANSKNYAYGTDDPEAIAYAIDQQWRGELPRTLFFDGRGGRGAISGRVDEATARRHLGLPMQPRRAFGALGKPPAISTNEP